MTDQLVFFTPQRPDTPPGFRYQSDVITADTEAALLQQFALLPFENFQFHQYTGNRRVVSYGWKYDYTARTNNRVSDIPAFLLDVRETAAAFAGIDPAKLQQALVTEYGPGAAIGWHRDKSVYGEIVGVSLLAPCTFRLRRKSASGYERVNLTAVPRSAYLLSGEARSEWEHSIPPVNALRYSITFRNLLAD